MADAAVALSECPECGAEEEQLVDCPDCGDDFCTQCVDGHDCEDDED